MKSRFVVGVFSLLFCLSYVTWAQADQVDLSTPRCNLPFKLGPGATCIADSAELANRNTPEKCSGIGLSFDGASCKAKGEGPKPYCQNVAGGAMVLVGEKCLFDSATRTSAAGDYVGDYFEINLLSGDKLNKFGYPDGTRFKVLAQKPLGTDDVQLTLVPVVPRRFAIGGFEPAGPSHTEKASDLIDQGAKRIGWTYGVLALPFKYYTHDKSFGTGVSVGPYVGRRWGAPGSAYTVAASAAIGSVKGEVRDATNNTVSTPDLMAYSIALGAMWDISKAPGVKPFKIGFFTGIDSVSTDNIVKFKNNRKPWLAFQIGFDFTDN